MLFVQQIMAHMLDFTNQKLSSTFFRDVTRKKKLRNLKRFWVYFALDMIPLDEGIDVDNHNKLTLVRKEISKLPIALYGKYFVEFRFLTHVFIIKFLK